MSIDKIIGIDKGDIVSPFIDYILEDKSKYVKANTMYQDRDDDFLIGDSGGFLMKIDFVFINTRIYSEVADHFDKYKRYCDYKVGTLEYNQFWARETKRRRQGMTAPCKLYFKDIDMYFNPNVPDVIKVKLLQPLRITGTHYNYLNYARINRTQNNKEQEISKLKGFSPDATVEGFARFWDGSYWKHKVDELASDNKFNRCDTKARRKGFTFQEANDSANIVNLNKGVNVIHFAYDEKEYLTNKDKLTYLTKRNLEWFDNHTYWKRGFISEDMSNIITGFKKSKEGNKKFGFQSSVTSVGVRSNTSAAAGSGAIKVKGEECGVNQVLKEAVSITRSVNEVGANRVGSLCLFGTGGTKGANWADFSHIYFNPRAYNMIPMENIWDKNARHSVSGFFFPQIWNCEPYIDEHGNSILRDAYYYDSADKENARKYNKGEDLLIYIGQRANSPEEAFITTIENIFTSVELSDQVKFTKYTEDIHFEDGLVVQDGVRYKFKSNNQLKLEGIVTHPYLIDVPFKTQNDNKGCIRIWHKPFRESYGTIPENQYFISYDTVRVNKDTKDITHKHSLNSFQIWECPNKNNNLSYFRLVAEYTGRFNTLEETDKLVLYCCEFWNCQVLFEYGSGETFINFKKWSKLNRLMKDPSMKIEQGGVKHQAGFGIVIGDGEKKLNGLTYIKEFIYEPIATTNEGTIRFMLQYIPCYVLLKELEIFDLKHNFDRISAFIVAIYKIKSITINKQNSLIKTQNPKHSLSNILNSFSL